MLATPRNAVTARDPEETQLNRTAAVLADVEEFEIAQIHEESANILSSIEGTIEPKHSKKFYKNPNNPQQLQGDCMFCNKPIASTGPTKFGGHLTSCALVPGHVRQPFLQLHRLTEQMKRAEKRLTLTV